MLKLYTWTTPNGYKVPIMLEELELPYEIVPVDIANGAQKTPEYLALNPNHKIPVLVDGTQTLRESGAILIYLADKTGELLATEGPERYAAIEWLMFQMASVGPMFGQANHFHKYAPEKIPYAIERYDKEVARLLGVLETQLNGKKYIAGGYSIADIATWPWVRSAKINLKIDLAQYPSVDAWFARMEERPAVKRALEKTDKACGK